MKRIITPLICLFLLLPATALAAGKGAIAILPFTINAGQDVSYLANGIADMLASRLAAGAGATVIPRTEVEKAGLTGTQSPEALAAAAKKLGAAYLLTGSYTALGASASLDATVLSAADKSSQRFFATATDKNAVIPAIDSLAWDIGEKVFGVKRPASATPATPAAAAPAAQAPAANAAPATAGYTTQHPEKAYINAGAKYGSAFIRPHTIAGAFGFTKSQNFRFSMQAFDVADIDGDGHDEVIMAGRQRVRVYQVKDGKFRRLAEITTPARYRLNYLSCADLDHDGRAEIYVSAHYGIEASAYGLIWKDNALQYIFQDAKFHIRAMKVPGRGMTLVGQRMGINYPFAPGLYVMKLKKGSLEATEGIYVPKDVAIFDFSFIDLENDGRSEIVAIDQNDRLRVRTRNGKELWVSSDHFGGSRRFVGTEVMEKVREDLVKPQERHYIPSRLIPIDLNSDGIDDLVVNKNLSSASRVIRNLRSYPSGELYGLGWNGIALAERWHTQKVDGYIVDYQIRPVNKDGTKVILYVGVILSRGIIEAFSENECTILMYQLDLTKPDSETAQRHP